MTTVALYLPSGSDLAQLDPVRRMYIGFMAQYLNSPATLAAYEQDLKNFDLFLAERQMTPPQVTRTDLELYIAWMQQHPAHWAESTIARRFGTVAGLYKWAAEEDILVKNPAARVKRPTVDHEKQRCTFLPPVDFATLLKYTMREGTVMEKAYVAIVGLRGLRIAEACSLNVSSYGDSRGYRTLTFLAKGSKARVVQVPPGAIRPIEDAIGDRGPDEPILLNQNGQRLNRVTGDRMLKGLATRAGVSTDISNHSLRRSFVTFARANGDDYDSIAETVGHRSTSTTKRYDKLAGTLERDISGRVAARLMSLAS